MLYKKERSREADLNHRPKDKSGIYSTVLRSTNWAITGLVGYTINIMFDYIYYYFESLI